MKNILINFKVRGQNKIFWITLIPAVLLLVQTIAAVFGYTIDLSVLGDRLIDVVEAIFSILVIVGIVVDPTTPGINDSENALTYTSPGVNENINDEEENEEEVEE